jgi:hypothetical protein
MITVTHLVIGSLITVRLAIGFMMTFDHLVTASHMGFKVAVTHIVIGSTKNFTHGSCHYM